MTPSKPLCLVQVRVNYGHARTYPVNGIAKLLAALTLKKTFTLEALQLIDRLGFEIEYVPTSIDAESIDQE